MNVRQYWAGIASRIWYEEHSSRPLWLILLYGPLLMAEGIYRLALMSNNLAFRLGLRRQNRVSMPVISVGNITVGGSGKSSLCLALAEELESRGMRVAAVSHSYGRVPGSNEAVIVSRDMSAAPAWRIVGDEAAMMAMEDPRLMVAGGSDKAVSLRKAAEAEADIIIIDDGFHRHDIHRDLDLVLLDSKKGIGNGHCLPCGPLREPLGALRRADALIISQSSPCPPREALQVILSGVQPGAPVITAAKVPAGLESWPDREARSIESLEGRPVFAFCGLGNPESFRETLEASGARLVGWRFFRDHHPYSRTDLDSIAEESLSAGAAMVITTAKDIVKVVSWPLSAPPLLVMKVKMVLNDPENWLGRRLDEITVRKSGRA